MQSKATTVEQYLSELPEDRRSALEAVRKVILDNLGKGYAEGMSYGMIGYGVPHSVFPAGYHCDPRQPLPFAGLASQKQHMSLYLMGLYMDRGPDGKPGPTLRWFEEAWKKSGRKLDMGKSCIRFKRLEDVALDVLAEALRRMPCDEFIATYQKGLDPRSRPTPEGKAASRPAKAATSSSTKGSTKVATKSATAKKPAAARKAATKKVAKKVARKSR